MKRIAILGAGNVGHALGTRWRDLGHEVTWGVRNPGDPKHAGLDTADVASAAAAAEIVVLAVPWAAAEATLKEAGSLFGKILIDAVNPIKPDFSGLADLGAVSASERIAAWAPDAAVVKAFNTVGSNIMENPRFGEKGTTLLVASDDAVAKAVVTELAGELGFDPVDAGGLAMARYLEAFAWVWIALATKQGEGREIVFQLLRR